MSIIIIHFFFAKIIISSCFFFLFKGILPQNIFILKTGLIGHLNSLNIGGSNKLFQKFGRKFNLSYFLFPEIMSQLYVQSKVCMAPFNVRSKVCFAPIHVRSKVCKFAPHMDWSNADFAPHMEGRQADFAPHMERRHSFRDKIIAKTAVFGNFQRELFKTTKILGGYKTYVTTFDNKNMLRESTFKEISIQPKVSSQNRFKIQRGSRVQRIIFLMNEYNYGYYLQKTYYTNTNMNIILDTLDHKYE